MERTIEKLTRLKGRVYVLLADEPTGAAFMQQAEAEGFSFADGVIPTARTAAQVMALNRDRTLNYVGAVGMIAFGSGAKRVGGERLIRVDYAKYAAGVRTYEF